MTEENQQPSTPPRYVDPNSGAAPQPGGFAMAPVADPERPKAAADNVTMPEDANEPPAQPEGSGEPQDQGVQELPEELQRSQSLDTEIQNQAAPQGPQPGAEDRDEAGGLAPYAADPSASTEEDGTPSAEAGTEGTTEGGSDETEGTTTLAPEDDEDDEDDTEGQNGLEEPAGNASTEAWQEYARSKGATEEDLKDKKRDELRENYGS